MLYFGCANKSHIYATPLWSRYSVWLHYKCVYCFIGFYMNIINISKCIRIAFYMLVNTCTPSTMVTWIKSGLDTKSLKCCGPAVGGAFHGALFDATFSLMFKSRKLLYMTFISVTIWATSWENLFMPYANNKGADQPAHPRSLISAFVVRCLDSIISLVSISEISSL